jgi:hypothetical protein
MGKVEGEAMGVQVRVGPAVLRPGREMHEFRPDHVAGFPVMVGALNTDARFHLALGFLHRFLHRVAEGVKDAVIAREFIEHRYRLGSAERKIEPHAP